MLHLGTSVKAPAVLGGLGALLMVATVTIRHEGVGGESQKKEIKTAPDYKKIDSLVHHKNNLK